MTDDMLTNEKLRAMAAGVCTCGAWPPRKGDAIVDLLVRENERLNERLEDWANRCDRYTNKVEAERDRLRAALRQMPCLCIGPPGAGDRCPRCAALEGEDDG